MMLTKTDIEGILLSEEWCISFAELTQLCGANRRLLELMVTEGVLHPDGQRPADWRFSGIELQRARRALRLQRDLDLNLAGTALALELLDELDTLRARLRCLEHQLGSLPRQEHC